MVEHQENIKHFVSGDAHGDLSKAFHSSIEDLNRPRSNGNINGAHSVHSSNVASSNGDLHRKPHTSHGDLRKWKIPRLSPQFFIFGSSLFLLALVCIAFPILQIYPSLNHSFLVRPHNALSLPLFHFMQRPQLNKTFLALAKVDLSENAERTQINNILDGTWHRTLQSRYPFLHDRFHHEDHYSDRFLERRRPARARDQRLPVHLSSPRYAAFWSQFRRSLHTWVQNKHYDSHVMQELLTMVKDPIDKHYTKKHNSTIEPGKPYKTCAVVGNSGILLNQTHAAFIDSHDMVMRLNNARISGFEQYVGSKTTLSFVNSNILHMCARRTGCYCHPYGADVPLIMYICQVIHFMDVAFCGSTHQAPIIVTDARFDTLCARIVKYYSLKRFVETTGGRLEDWSDAHEGPLFHYSSGMQAVLLAVGICERVNIFGFGKSENLKHHYHTTQRAELRLHDYSAEYDFYMDLSTQDPQLIPFLNEAGFSLPLVHIYW